MTTALLAMKGMMLQEELTIDDAFKVMELGQNEPSRMAPALPPKMLSEYHLGSVLVWCDHTLHESLLNRRETEKQRPPPSVYCTFVHTILQP